MAAVKEGMLFDNDVKLAKKWVDKKGVSSTNEKADSEAATKASKAAGTAAAYTAAAAKITSGITTAYDTSAASATTTGSYLNLAAAVTPLETTYKAKKKIYDDLLVTHAAAIAVYDQDVLNKANKKLYAGYVATPRYKAIVAPTVFADKMAEAWAASLDATAKSADALALKAAADAKKTVTDALALAKSTAAASLLAA